MNRGIEIPFANGEPVPEMELVLSTGYRVAIDPQSPVASFAHLARALLGEIFIKVSSDKGDYGPGIDATIQEISSLVEQLEGDEACVVLKVALWAAFLQEYEAVRKRTAGRKKKKRKH